MNELQRKDHYTCPNCSALAHRVKELKAAVAEEVGNREHLEERITEIAEELGMEEEWSSNCDLGWAVKEKARELSYAEADRDALVALGRAVGKAADLVSLHGRTGGTCGLPGGAAMIDVLRAWAALPARLRERLEGEGE